MRRILIATWLFSVLPPCAFGARDIEFNVDFACGWDGYYRPMEWTPLEIAVSSDLETPFGGSIVISARQDGLNTLNIIHSFVLTPGISASLPLVTKFAFGTNRCDIMLRDKRGRRRHEQTINLWDYSAANRSLRPVREEDLLIGLIGQSSSGILRLPQETQSASARGQGKVFVGAKVPRMVPWDWTGFVSLDVLVLCDPDWTLLRPEQGKAIRDWVFNGGTVLLILGRHPLPAGSPLRELLPFQIGDPRQVSVPSETLEEWGLNGNQPEAVTAWTLRTRSDAPLTKVVELPNGTCLYGLARAGFGRVAVLAFDPAQLSRRQNERTAAFWTGQLATCLADGSGFPAQPDQADSGAVMRYGRTITLAGGEESNQPSRYEQRFRITPAQNANNQVLEHLYQIRQMRPLSIWWVVLTLAALAILLGPVDYLVLKRLDKLPYTWLTSTGWIVVFTFGAYYGVQWVRGGDMEVRAVSVLDGIADSNCAWATTYMGVFAPRSDDYRIGGLRPNQWWSGLAPSQQEFWMHQREAGMRQIHCVQADGGNLPASLPINIWTVQSLTGEWALGALPFTATVQRRQDTVTAEITNTSDVAIRAGYVLFDDAFVTLDPVPGRSSRRFERPIQHFSREQLYPPLPPRPRNRPGREAVLDMPLPRYPVSLGGPADSAFFAQGALPRTLAMHEYLRSGGGLVCVVFEEASLPFEIENRSYRVNHIQLARQLILNRRPTDANP